MATRSSTLAWRIPIDRGAWQATVHGVTKSQTQLGDKAHITVMWMVYYDPTFQMSNARGKSAYCSKYAIYKEYYYTSALNSLCLRIYTSNLRMLIREGCLSKLCL